MLAGRRAELGGRLMQPDDFPSLQTVLKRISKLCNSSFGQPLDDLGLVRILNQEGSKPPLVWCFNAGHEFPSLAQALGSDQPLIALRSLQGVVPTEQKNSHLDFEIGAYYAQSLADHLKGGSLAVGGNCQGAGIAYLAMRGLLERGCTISQLICLDATLKRPVPVPVRLFYGQKSQLSPKQSGQSLAHFKRQCHFSYRRFSLNWVPGAHGQYFDPGNVAALAKYMGHALGNQLAWQENNYKLNIVESPVSVVLSVENLSRVPIGFLPVWHTLQGAIFMPKGHEWIKSIKSHSCQLFEWPKPDRVGVWRLSLIPCHQDLGPCMSNVPSADFDVCITI